MRELEKFVERISALYNRPLDIAGAREIVNEKKIDLNKKDTPQGKGMNISNGGKTPKQKKECCG